MNFLMYIGGGILFMGVVLHIVLDGDYYNRTDYDEGVKEKAAKYISVLASLFVWIWICWKFIK